MKANEWEKNCVAEDGCRWRMKMNGSLCSYERMCLCIKGTEWPDICAPIALRFMWQGKSNFR